MKLIVIKKKFKKVKTMRDLRTFLALISVNDGENTIPLFKNVNTYRKEDKLVQFAQVNPRVLDKLDCYLEELDGEEKDN